jgi:hypothetical protein
MLNKMYKVCRILLRFKIMIHSSKADKKLKHKDKKKDKKSNKVNNKNTNRD